ncbi:pyrroline-5-carboxylate reductase 1, mitochondrial-like [Cimex lectularius]|uniref:Pyrroline-5-carboxylate reductase n=1 Tax=Cimex lectularius TaxID=79782 RepID=A0A8I6SJ83_CIMLE|nr:pyrroline-5-carboxylate reductase 1, mitochondrial-like [Cimex lectularius]
MNIGFIGGGRLAQALLKGFLAAGITKGSNVTASCAPEDKFSVDGLNKIGAVIEFNNKVVVNKSDLTIIAVKPNIMPLVLKEIQDTVTPKNLILSVAMGVTLEQIENALPKETRVIRVMPNTPALVMSGATVFAKGKKATEADGNTTKRLFDSVGICEEVPEYLFDAVTALSGSGPAYIYTVIEALSDGAVRMGMTRELAYKLAAQTVVGAGAMVKTGEHPGVLKDNVTSPAGSTCEGLYYLERNNVRASFIEAIEKATLKCKETSKNNSK